MDKTFIFRDYTNNVFYPLLVNIDKNTGVILVDAYAAGAILGLSEEDIQAHPGLRAGKVEKLALGSCRKEKNFLPLQFQ